MFTGIIESTGTIKEIIATGTNKSFWVVSPLVNDLKVDQSLSHNGVCLTVEEIKDGMHRVTAIVATLIKTNLGSWQKGDIINLERCMQLNDRLDGHIVQGHVDCTAECTDVVEKDGSWEYRFSFAGEFAAFIIEKGSVTVNGISLTCFNVTHTSFTVAIIPYTFEHTNMSYLKKGDLVNIEWDVVGKYVHRIMEIKKLEQTNTKSILIKDKQFIPALTGIRAIAVYFIFFKHLNFFSPQTQPNLYLFVNQFYSFLTFFFVLSGFLIYYKYHEISSLNKTKLYNYFINRISRVFPILIILISITFLLGYFHGVYTGKEAVELYLLNISLLKGFSSTYLLTGIGPSWSMSVEELFYLLSPLIFLFTKKVSSLVKFVVLFYLMGILITWLFSLYPVNGFFSDNFFMLNYTFFGRVFEFACGIYLAMLVKGKVKPFFSKQPGKIILYTGILIVSSAITILFFIATKYNIKQATDILAGILINNLLMPLGISFIFYSLIYQKSLLQRFLSSKLMVALGNATYSFYLLHTTFVLSYIFKFISDNIFVAFILMIIISFIFHKTVEQPLAILIRKKLSKKQH